MIRVAIVASSPLARAGLEALAGSSAPLQVAGVFEDFTDIEHARADVVVAAAGVEEIPALESGQATPVILISAQPPPAWTPEALRAGVRAMLGPDAGPAEILAAVEAAATGLAVIAPQDLDALLTSTLPAQNTGETSPLTPRELEVLRMMADGAANKMIAWTLGISEHTVKFHVASILAKLGASSRTEAVTTGIRKGLVLL